MKFRECRLLADQNIDVGLIAFLRSEGFDVVEVGAAGLGDSDDDDILRRAIADSRVVLTHDSDFGTLVVRNKAPFFGIVYLRPGHVPLASNIDGVRELLAKDLDVRPPFVIVVKRTGDSVKIRIR